MEHFISRTCSGAKCSICGHDATHKVGEEIANDDPNMFRHNYTAYVCCEHFKQIFGAAVPCKLDTIADTLKAAPLTPEQITLIALDDRLTACFVSYNNDIEPSKSDLADGLAAMCDLIGSGSLGDEQLYYLAGTMFYVSGLVPDVVN
jgi:hypothetical protein